MHNQEEQLLKEAAEAAQALIVKLEAERAELLERVNQIDARIARLRPVLSAAGFSVNALRNLMVASPSAQDISSEVEQPSAYVRVRALLDGKPLIPAKEIKDAYEVTYGQKLPMSTLYFALRKGINKGTIKEIGGKYENAKN